MTHPAAGCTIAIGSYTAHTGGRGEGITLVTLGGDRLEVGPTVASPSPSYVVWSRSGDLLLAVNETEPGTVTSFAYDGRLRETGSRSSDGGLPCHLGLSADEEHVSVANYGGGPFVSMGLSGGELGPAVATPANREGSPHPHGVELLTSDDGSPRVALSDLGLDQVSLHESAQGVGRLLDVVDLPAGTGPRTIARLGSRLVVSGELDGTLVVLDLDGDHLVLAQAGHPCSGRTQDANPSHVAPLGDDRVVVANRGPNTVAVHRLGDDGLTLLDELPLPGANPRHLAVVDERRLLVCLQDSHRVVLLDLADGSVLDGFDLGSPTCAAVRPDAAG